MKSVARASIEETPTVLHACYSAISVSTVRSFDCCAVVGISEVLHLKHCLISQVTSRYQ